jgi:hypothetical protein
MLLHVWRSGFHCSVNECPQYELERRYRSFYSLGRHSALRSVWSCTRQWIRLVVYKHPAFSSRFTFIDSQKSKHSIRFFRHFDAVRTSIDVNCGQRTDESNESFVAVQSTDGRRTCPTASLEPFGGNATNVDAISAICQSSRFESSTIRRSVLRHVSRQRQQFEQFRNSVEPEHSVDSRYGDRCEQFERQRKSCYIARFAVIFRSQQLFVF